MWHLVLLDGEQLGNMAHIKEGILCRPVLEDARPCVPGHQTNGSILHTSYRRATEEAFVHVDLTNVASLQLCILRMQASRQRSTMLPNGAGLCYFSSLQTLRFQRSGYKVENK